MKKHLLQALLAAALLSFLFTGCSKDPDFSYSSPDSIGASSGKIKNGSIPETPIEFDIDIPAGTQDVNIYRRRVDKLTHSPMEEWRRIAGKWIDPSDRSADTTGSFWDKYVQNNKCYEYKVDFQPENDSIYTRNLGFHLAGYEGYEEPYFVTFPTISYEPSSGAFTLSSSSPGSISFDPDDDVIQWYNYNFSYGWRVFPWLDEGSNSTYTLDSSELDNLRPGNNNLTNFTLKFHFDGDDFDYMVDFDVNDELAINYYNIPRGIPGELEYDVSYLGIFMEVQPLDRAFQIFIERAIDDGYTTLDDSDYETIGFMNISEGGHKEYYDFADYFYGANTYDYRVKFIMDDWSTEVVIPMGTVQITAAGYDEDSLSFSPSLEFDYDYDDNDNLYWYQSYSDYQDLYVSLGSSTYSLNTYYGYNWGGYIVFEYEGIDTDGNGNSHKMWPSFNSLGSIPDKNYSVNFDPDLVPSFWSIPDDEMTFVLREVDIDLYLPGTEIPRRFKYTSYPIPVDVTEIAQIDLDLSPYFD